MKCSFSKCDPWLYVGSIICFWVPFSFFVAGIIMVLVARFDESFKPCPVYIRENKYSKTRNSGTYTFSNFCGQTMNPRVTTCCRVPCSQNFTTYFDLQGNPDDCVSQSFETMAVTIIGFVSLGSCLFVLLCVVVQHVRTIKSKSRDRSILEETFCLPDRFPEVTTADAGELQVV